MPTIGLMKRVAVGAEAGFVGTLALQLLRTGSQRWLPRSMPPIRTDPGEYIVQRVEAALPSSISKRVPTIVETALAKSLAIGYGLTAGALYAWLRPRGGPLLRDGPVLGLGVWATGYLGWLLALDLMPPLRQQHRLEVIAPAIRHGLFGITTVWAYRWLREQQS